MNDDVRVPESIHTCMFYKNNALARGDSFVLLGRPLLNNLRHRVSLKRAIFELRGV